LEFSKIILIFAQQLKLNQMDGFLIGYKKRMAAERKHTEELEQFKKDHAEVVRLLLKDHGLELMTMEKEMQAVVKRTDRDMRLLADRLTETEQKLKAQLSEKDRMENLLTKVSKRSATYRTMMEAVAAWEEEIAMEREEDKLEEFIKWNNNREDV